jgi:hypothetical protein
VPIARLAAAHAVIKERGVEALMALHSSTNDRGVQGLKKKSEVRQAVSFLEKN